MALVELNLDPTPKQLRTFGLIGLVFFGGFAAWAYFKQRIFGFELEAETAQLTAIALGAIAGLHALLAAAFPRGLKPFFIGLSVITLPIGFVLSYVIMVSLFYLLLTPIGLLMRLGGWDAMERKIAREKASYWKRRPAMPRVDRYFRQF